METNGEIWPAGAARAMAPDAADPSGTSDPSGASATAEVGAGDIGTPSKRPRVWHAILTLYVLAPIVAEMLSGSTPPLAWRNPFNPIVQPALYGSGALLAREVVRRRGLGWANLLVLGAAYSILEEGLAVQTWFNFTPHSPSANPTLYGVFFGTDWVWAAQLAAYHAIISITIPVMLVELIFPRLADRPWLRRRAVMAFSILLAVDVVALALLTGFVQFRRDGYTHPPTGPYLLATALMVALFWFGWRLRVPAPRPSPRRVPRLWTVRFTVLAATLTFFVFALVLPPYHPIAAIAFALIVALVTLALWRVRSWSAREGWGARHRLAIAMGVIAFFALIFAPLQEFAGLAGRAGKGGLTLVGVLFLLGLFALDWRLRAHERVTTKAG